MVQGVGRYGRSRGWYTGVQRAANRLLERGDRLIARWFGQVGPPNTRQLAFAGGPTTFAPLAMVGVKERGGGSRESKGLLLVVDDVVDIHPVMEQMFTQEGYDVIFAASEAEAIDIISKKGPQIDIMITDLKMMGDIDAGIRVLEEARRTNPNIAAVVMTAYSTKKTAINSLFGGAVKYYEKDMEGFFEALISGVNDLREEQVSNERARASELRQAEKVVAKKVLSGLQDYFSQGLAVEFGNLQFIESSLDDLRKTYQGLGGIEIYKEIMSALSDAMRKMEGRNEMIYLINTILVPPRELSVVQCKINDIIQQAIARLEPMRASKVQFEPQPDFPDMLLSRELIQRALAYFLDYAAAAAVNRGEEGQARIRAAVEDKDAQIVIVDNGRRYEQKEFSLEVLEEHAFSRRETFFHESHVKMIVGKLYIEAHGGAITEIEGDNNSGITLTIRLPINRITEQSG